MANEPYSVGNLQISFSALDKTSEDFKALSANLRAVVNIINRISTADLGKFTANVKEITRAFTPFLNKINKSTAGLQAFNDVARQVGIKNMSAVVTELERTAQETRNAAGSQRELNDEMEDGANAAQNLPAIYNEMANALQAVSEAQDHSLEVLQVYNQALATTGGTAAAWRNIYAALNFSNAQLDVDRANEALNQLGTEFLRNKQIVDETNEAFRRMQMTEQELVIADYQAEQSARKQRIAYLEAALAMGTAGNQTREFTKELERLRKEDGKLGKKSGLSKFLGQVKRIAIYRAIRAGLKAITSAAKEGISAYAQFDSSINQTMSQLKTSTTIIKTSFGATLIPILQAVTPIIQQISVGFANMANVINASMSKTGTYTKINTDRLLAYNKAANLFDFDKFRSLNKGDDATSLFSTEKVEDLNDELGESFNKYKVIYDIIKDVGQILNDVWRIIGQIWDAISPYVPYILKIVDGILKVASAVLQVLTNSGLLYPILGGILGYFIALGVTKFITWLKTGALSTWFKNAAAGATTFQGKLLAVLGTTQALAVGMGALAGSLMYFIQNLDKMGTTAKVIIPIIAALAAVITGVAVARAAAAAGIAAPLKAGITAAALAAAITLAAGTAIGVAVGKYANGGIPPQGTLFYAGEAGAEMVYNTPSGQSGVANIQQITQAVYQGTYQATMDWWKTAKNEIGGDVYLDSEKIYQGVGRAAGKHGKRFADVR